MNRSASAAVRASLKHIYTKLLKSALSAMQDWEQDMIQSPISETVGSNLVTLCSRISATLYRKSKRVNDNIYYW